MPKTKKEAVLKKVLKKIVPKKSEQKRLKALANRVIEMVNKESAISNELARRANGKDWSRDW